MCRNIRVLHHFKPPTTISEIRAAAAEGTAAMAQHRQEHSARVEEERAAS